MVISEYWTLLTVSIIVHATQGPNDFIQTELFSKMEKELGRLCPKVDICNRNSSEPNVLPNGLVGAGNQTACCQGCSCHERCHENMNCCFPHDDNDTSDVESNPSAMECLYVRTGTPDETWPRNEPAYRIVSSAPKRGCVDYTLSEASKRVGLLPSCDKDPVALWGNLFPVYSKKIEIDKIYQNAACALCHNITDVIPSLPVLYCNDPSRRGKITISQNLQFLQRNLLTSNCYIAFHFSDPSILANKRCHHELVSTCKLPSPIDTIPAVTYTNLSSTDIREACESGLKSPVWTYSMMYRNIYCYFCNVRTWSMYMFMSCTVPSNPKATITGKFSVLLDAVYFKKRNQNGISDGKIAFPEACVSNGPSLTSERCRNILCPSGQIRTRTGCKVPSKSWFVGLVSLVVQLNYPEGQYDNISTLFQQRKLKQTDVKDWFLENKPWPSLWKLMTIAHTDESHPQRAVLIFIVSESNSPAILFRSIKNSIGKQWTVNLNGSSVDFEQSILKYSRANKNWNFNVLVNEIGIAPSRELTQLFVCDQVSLYSGEFDLTLKNTVLISNLTIRILYDMEFELVYDVNTIVTVWVCLSDTVFKTKNDSNGSQKELLATITIVLAFYLHFC